MYFEKATRPVHNRDETYRVTFTLKEADDLYDVKGFGVQFTIRPETVTLVWERWKDGDHMVPWRRVGYRPRGAFSAFKGPRVLKNGDTTDKQEGVAEVFGHRGLTDYARTFPHLEQMIEELESQLPE